MANDLPLRLPVLLATGRTLLAKLRRLAHKSTHDGSNGAARALPRAHATRQALMAEFPADPQATLARSEQVEAADPNGYREWYSAVDAVSFNRLASDVGVLEDAAAFHEHAVALLRDAATTLAPAEVDASRHPALLGLLCDLFALVVRVSVAADACPRVLILQAYGVLACGRFQGQHKTTAEERTALSRFVAAFSPPLPRVQLDLAPATLLLVALLEADAGPACTYLARADSAQVAAAFAAPPPSAPTLFGRGVDDAAEAHAADETVARVTALNRIAEASTHEARVLLGVIACPFALAAAPPSGMLLAALREILSSTRAFDVGIDGMPVDVHALFGDTVVASVAGLQSGTTLAHALQSLGVTAATASSCATTWADLAPRLRDTADSECLKRHEQRRTVARHALGAITHQLLDVLAQVSPVDAHGPWMLDRWLVMLAALRLHACEMAWAMRHARFVASTGNAPATAAASAAAADAAGGLGAHHAAYAASRGAASRAAVAASRALSHMLKAHVGPPLARLLSGSPPGAESLVRELYDVHAGATGAAADAYAALCATPGPQPPPDLGRFRLGMLRVSVALCGARAPVRAGLLDSLALGGPGGVERPGDARAAFAVAQSVVGSISRALGSLSHAVDRAGAWLDEHARLDASSEYLDDLARYAVGLAQDPLEQDSCRVRDVVPGLAFACASAVRAAPPAVQPHVRHMAARALREAFKALAGAAAAHFDRLSGGPGGPYALELAVMQYATTSAAQYQRDTAASPSRRRSSISPMAGTAPGTSALPSKVKTVMAASALGSEMSGRRRRGSSVHGTAVHKLMQKSPPLPGAPGSESMLDAESRAALTSVGSSADRLGALLAGFDADMTEMHAAAVLEPTDAPPRDVLVDALVAAFRTHVRRSAATPAPEDAASGTNAACVRGPEGLARSVAAATTVLANAQPHTPRVDLAARVVREALDNEAKDEVGSEKSVLAWYAEWYDRFVICDVGGCAASHDPNNLQFTTGTDARARLGGSVPLLEEYTSPEALIAFVRTFGPAAVRALDARISSRLCDAFAALDTLVGRNPAPLAEIAAAAMAVDEVRAMRAVRILGDDVVIAVHAHLVAFGRALALRSLLRSAANEARATAAGAAGCGKAAPEVVAHAFLASEFVPASVPDPRAEASFEASKGPLRLDAQLLGFGDAYATPLVPRGAAGLLAAAAPCSQEARAPDASAFGRFLNAHLDARSSERMSLLPSLLAVAFADAEAWSQVRFNAPSGGWDMSTHLIADAMVHIFRGLADAACRGRRAAAAVHVGAHAEAAVLAAGLFAQAQASRDGGVLRPYPEDGGYRARVLVLDRLRTLLAPDESTDECMEALNAFAPHALIRSAYESVLEGAPPGLEIPPPSDT